MHEASARIARADRREAAAERARAEGYDGADGWSAPPTVKVTKREPHPDDPFDER